MMQRWQMLQWCARSGLKAWQRRHWRSPSSGSVGLAPGGTAPGFEITAARPTDREGDGIAGRQSLSDQSPAWVVARGNQSWPSYAPFDPPPPRRRDWASPPSPGHPALTSQMGEQPEEGDEAEHAEQHVGRHRRIAQPRGHHKELQRRRRRRKQARRAREEMTRGAPVGSGGRVGRIREHVPKKQMRRPVRFLARCQAARARHAATAEEASRLAHSHRPVCVDDNGPCHRGAGQTARVQIEPDAMRRLGATPTPGRRCLRAPCTAARHWGRRIRMPLPRFPPRAAVRGAPRTAQGAPRLCRPVC